MAKQAEEQNIRSKARRRLIGAVALALAVVVILPMVLDSEPRITGKDIDLRIPDAEKIAAFVPGVVVSEVVEANTLAESAVIAIGASAVSSVPEAAVSGKVVEANLEVRKTAVATGQLVTPEDKRTDLKPADVKKPELSEVKPDARPVEKTSGIYIVQVGAYANAATASQEEIKLKGWGFKAYTEMIAGTTRVRVGPYTDRGKADEVRTLLEKHGLHPVISATK